MKTKQKPIAEKPQRKDGGELSPTTTLMIRDTLKDYSTFQGRGLPEMPRKDEDNKGAQKGKTPLGIWQQNRTEDVIC